LDFGRRALPSWAINSRGQLAAGQWSGGGETHVTPAMRVSCASTREPLSAARRPATTNAVRRFIDHVISAPKTFCTLLVAISRTLEFFAILTLTFLKRRLTV
jgi:hypothetical protein